jgi:hypothetical protein
MPRTKYYHSTSGLVHYGTNIYAVEDKTIYRCSDTTMEISASLVLTDTISYFYGANGNLWCVCQISAFAGGPPVSGKVVLVNAATLTVTRTTDIAWVPLYAACDDNALYVPQDGSGWTGGSVTRFLASDGSISVYTGVGDDGEITTDGVFTGGGFVWWATRSPYYYPYYMVKIDPADMTRIVGVHLVGFSFPVSELLTDGTYVYFRRDSVSRSMRADMSFGNITSEVGDVPNYYPKGMVLWEGYVYFFAGATGYVHKTRCSDMAVIETVEYKYPFGSGMVTDGTGLWSPSWLTSAYGATRCNWADFSWIDSIYSWIGSDDNAVWFFGI